MAGLLMALAVSSYAQTQIPLVWGYSLSSWQGAMAREIVQEANAIQNRFVFVLENRPGAGGAVSVNHVLSSKTPMVLANSDSFFTRPAMHQEGSYDVNAFIPLTVYCLDQPVGLISKNIPSVKDLSVNRQYTIGINPGSIVELVANELARQRSTISLTEVPFKTTAEIPMAVLGDHIDFAISFLNSIQDERLKTLAITGNRNIGSLRTFQSQGVAGLEKFTVGYYLLVSRSLDPKMINELSSVLARASQGSRVQEACAKDYGQAVSIAGAQAQKIFNERRDFWTNVVRVMPKK